MDVSQGEVVGEGELRASFCSAILAAPPYLIFFFSLSLFSVCECTFKSTFIYLDNKRVKEKERRESYPGNIKLEILAKN